MYLEKQPHIKTTKTITSILKCTHVGYDGTPFVFRDRRMIFSFVIFVKARMLCNGENKSFIDRNVETPNILEDLGL